MKKKIIIGIFLFLFLGFINFSYSSTGPVPYENVYVYKLLPEHENLMFVKMHDGKISNYPGIGEIYRIPNKLHGNYQYSFGLIGAGYDNGGLINITYTKYMNLLTQPDINKYQIVTDKPYIERYFCKTISLGNYSVHMRRETQINETINELNKMIDDGRLFTECQKINPVEKKTENFFMKIKYFFIRLFTKVN